MGDFCRTRRVFVTTSPPSRGEPWDSHGRVPLSAKGPFYFDNLPLQYRGLRPQRTLQSMPGRRQPSQPIDHAYRQHQAAQGAHLLGWEVRLVMQGVIVKLVRSYGSAWGRIEPLGGGRQVFFNKASLPEGADFADLRDGQVVQFEEEDDRANGTHAVRIVLGDLPKMGSTATPNTSILPGR